MMQFIVIFLFMYVMDKTSTSIVCDIVLGEDHQVICSNQTYSLHEDILSARNPHFWVYLVSYICLVLFAGTMSGLTLAIFSLDMTSLRVLQKAGSPKDIKYASRIMPLVRRQYLVLVSLVLANSLAVECMPLLLDRISSPYVAVAVSVSLVLIFGEVVPQAVCGRHSLMIGYHLAWLVWTLIALLFLITWPMSKLLNWILGVNEGTFYRRAELKALIDIHGPQKKKRVPKTRTVGFKSLPLKPQSISEKSPAERLTIDEVLIISGALQLATKCAKDAMMNLSEVYMLSIDDKINGQKLQEVLEEGHSRIPVYWEKNRQKILGVLLTKRLITADPSKSTPVKDFILDCRYFYPPYFIDINTPLYLLLNTFQEGKSTHMGFVTEKKSDNSIQIVGVITLEDVIEELLMEEIYDETDIIRNVNINRRLHLTRAHAIGPLKSSVKATKLNSLSKKSQQKL